MNLYSKDFLLDGKIVYYQLKKGYRSGIEPIILASNAKKKHNKILDMGSGCGSISLIVAYRNPESEVIGFEKNETHHKTRLEILLIFSPHFHHTAHINLVKCC